jgi:hypothetical protein
MVGIHRGTQIPLEVYHGVPAGWLAGEIVTRHTMMRGTYPLSAFESQEQGVPARLMQRSQWQRYRDMLRHVADGARLGDAACAEIATCYIEMRYIGSYSGFLRARLARALKSADLTHLQVRRLNAHFLQLVLNNDYTEEFRDYHRLWRKFIPTMDLATVVAHSARPSRRPHNATWLVQLCEDCAARYNPQDRAVVESARNLAEQLFTVADVLNQEQKAEKMALLLDILHSGHSTKIRSKK